MEFKILTGVLSRFLLELSLLEETAASLESTITGEINSMDDELVALRPQLDAEWEAEDAQDIQDEFRDLSEAETRYAELDEGVWARRQHRQIVRSALFLATYAAFEQCLDGLAHEWRDARGLDLRPADLRHQGIERSKAYLTKVVKMPFPTDTAEWGRICHLRAIRNQLAHDGPDLTDPPGPKLRAAFAAFPGIYKKEDQRVSVTNDFLKEAFRCLHAFTQTLVVRNEAFSSQKIRLID